eukprot:TRINITY_DN11154_c0_g2_i5.p1 TRINITY_DN11154_c0_g2~~TRINITY_DN11154_c0_g2_i5.p1  ORF type:complete len:143 (+),score=0.94 TRINITY_DN11154_c0_g2_i5:180-608(+)
MTSELDSQTDVRTPPQYSLEHLKTIATELIKKYPSKIPIICKPAPSSSLPPLHKKTLLADGSLSVGWILGYLRTQLALDKREALFLEVKGKSFPQCKARVHSSVYIEGCVCGARGRRWVSAPNLYVGKRLWKCDYNFCVIIQ